MPETTRFGSSNGYGGEPKDPTGDAAQGITYLGMATYQ